MKSMCKKFGRLLTCAALCAVLSASAADVKIPDATDVSALTVPAGSPVNITIQPAPLVPAGTSIWATMWNLCLPLLPLLLGSGGIVAGLMHWDRTKYQGALDTASRWEGVIMHVFNEAEDSGVLNQWSGNQKLAHAMNSFDTVFREVFGTSPTAQDRADAKVDLAVAASKNTAKG